MQCRSCQGVEKVTTVRRLAVARPSLCVCVCGRMVSCEPVSVVLCCAVQGDQVRKGEVLGCIEQLGTVVDVKVRGLL